LHFSNAGEAFASKFVKPIQGYHPIEPVRAARADVVPARGAVAAELAQIRAIPVA